MTNIAAILLAAGKSQRMEGNNKLLMLLDGRPVLSRVADEISRAPFAEVVAVTGYQQTEVEQVLKPFQIPVVHNPHFSVGMHASIRSGLNAISPAHHFFAVCLGDQPFLTTGDYCAMIDAAKAHPEAKLIYPESNGDRGNPTLISMSLRDEVLAHPDNDKGCAYLFAKYQAPHEAIAVDLSRSSAHHIFLDVDTPSAFSQAAGFIADERLATSEDSKSTNPADEKSV